jgi:hypothetical protein
MLPFFVDDMFCVEMQFKATEPTLFQPFLKANFFVRKCKSHMHPKIYRSESKGIYLNSLR